MPAEGLACGRQRQQQQQSRQQAAHLLLADLDPESVPAAIQRLFNASVVLDDLAFHGFVGAFCKLSLEMISMQSGRMSALVLVLLGKELWTQKTILFRV